MKTNTLSQRSNQSSKNIATGNDTNPMRYMGKPEEVKLDYFTDGSCSTKYKVNTMTHYPDPFDQKTSIVYKLDYPSYVSLVVYSEVKKGMTYLACGYRHEGYHKVDFDASKLPSGAYVARLRTNRGVFKEIITKLGSNNIRTPE